MAYYTSGAAKAMRKLGIKTIGVMPTPKSLSAFKAREEKAKAASSRTLLDVDTHNPTFAARMRMQLASLASEQPLAVCVGEEEIAKFMAQPRDVRLRNKQQHPVAQGFDDYVFGLKDKMSAESEGKMFDVITRLKNHLRDRSRQMAERRKTNADVVRVINTQTSELQDWIDEHLFSEAGEVVNGLAQSMASRTSTFFSSHEAEMLVVYRERTQWVKAQYQQDLARIRQVQSKLQTAARKLQERANAAERSHKQLLAVATPRSDEEAYCATRTDHVKRMAVESNGIIKELSADIARLQAEIDDLKKKIERERMSRQMAEDSRKKLQLALEDANDVLLALRKKYGNVERDMAERDAARLAAEKLAEEMQLKWKESQRDLMRQQKAVKIMKSQARKAASLAQKQRETMMQEIEQLQVDIGAGYVEEYDDEDGPPSAAQRDADAAARRRQQLARLQQRRKQPPPPQGMAALSGENMEFNGPPAVVNEVDCTCTCGAAYDAGEAAAAGEEGEQGRARSPVQHAPDCALFHGPGDDALQLAASKFLRKTTSTLRLQQVPGAATPASARSRRARSARRSRSPAQLGGSGVYSPMISVAGAGSGVQSGRMGGEAELPVRWEGSSGAGEGEEAAAGAFRERVDPRWQGGSLASQTSYKSWMMRHHRKFGGGRSSTASLSSSLAAALSAASLEEALPLDRSSAINPSPSTSPALAASLASGPASASTPSLHGPRPTSALSSTAPLPTPLPDRVVYYDMRSPIRRPKKQPHLAHANIASTPARGRMARPHSAAAGGRIAATPARSAARLRSKSVVGVAMKPLVSDRRGRATVRASSPGMHRPLQQPPQPSTQQQQQPSSQGIRQPAASRTQASTGHLVRTPLSGSHVVKWQRVGHVPDGSKHIVHSAFAPSSFAPVQQVQWRPEDVPVATHAERLAATAALQQSRSAGTLQQQRQGGASGGRSATSLHGSGTVSSAAMAASAFLPDSSQSQEGRVEDFLPHSSEPQVYLARDSSTAVITKPPHVAGRGGKGKGKRGRGSARRSVRTSPSFEGKVRGRGSTLSPKRRRGADPEPVSILTSGSTKSVTFNASVGSVGKVDAW